MKLLIRNAVIIDPEIKSTGRLNVLVDKGKISYIGTDSPEAEQVIEAEGCLLSAGWIDMRAFVGEPGLEHREDIASICKVAANGGFSGVALLPNTQPVVQTKDTVSFIQNRSAMYATTLYPMAAVTLQTKGEQLSEMIDLHEAGAIAFSDGIKPIWQSDILLKTLLYLQKFDGLLINRPEDLSLTKFGTMHEGVYSAMLGLKGMPSMAEEMMVARDLRLLEYAGGKIHFSLLSTAGSVAQIREAKQKGLKVTCDVAAHQLVFDEKDLMEFDTNLKVNPPFRSQGDIAALRAGLADGTIDAIVSDHMPHDTESKQLEFDLADFGIIGLQTAFANANMHSGLATEQLVEKFSWAPRKILGLPAAAIKVGEVADLTLFNPGLEWTFTSKSNLSKSQNSPFIGLKLKGKALAVINKGILEISHEGLNVNRM